MALASPVSPIPVSRVLVAMSGGVDSSVAAALLKEQGHDVVGVTLHLWDYPDDGSVKGRCCAPEDQHDARRVADHLGIPHFAFDRREAFLARVVTPFVEGYLDGETPSPCVACNRGPKTEELFALADRLGASHVATGHYARIAVYEGRPWLHRGRDDEKDQSYFLHALTPDRVARLVLPLGDRTKDEVRREAVRLGIPSAAKGESQELCFVPGRYDAFVEARADQARIRPGPILDASGREVGRHAGVHRFTIGQRKGLGVALGAPAFVTRIDGATGAVHLGDEAALGAWGLEADDAALAPEVPAETPARLKVRARHDGETGRLQRLPDGKLRVRFDRPVRAVSVGQYVVAYDGDRVLGGARITSVDGPEVHA